MPTYVYRCAACGHQFEKFQKISARNRPRCPRCGSTVERVITGGAGLLFKGSGFYITDYKKDRKAQEEHEGQKGEKPQKAEKADQPEKAEPKKPRDER